MDQMPNRENTKRHPLAIQSRFLHYSSPEHRPWGKRRMHLREHGIEHLAWHSTESKSDPCVLGTLRTFHQGNHRLDQWLLKRRIA